MSYNFTKFSVHVTIGRGSVFLWRQCNTLCICGFMDDAICSYHRACGVRRGLRPKNVNHRETMQREAELQRFSPPPLSALSPAEWHSSAVSLALHNGVWLWRRTVSCARGTKSAIIDYIGSICKGLHKLMIILLFLNQARVFSWPFPNSTNCRPILQRRCRLTATISLWREMPLWTTLAILLMAALCNRASHYIFAVVSSSFSFPRLIAAVSYWMSTIVVHMVWP